MKKSCPFLHLLFWLSDGDPLLQPPRQMPQEQPGFASSCQRIPLEKLRVCPHSSLSRGRTETPHTAKAVIPLPQSSVWVPLGLKTGRESKKMPQITISISSPPNSVDHSGGLQLGCLPFHKTYGARHLGLPQRGGSVVTHLNQFPRQLGQTRVGCLAQRSGEHQSKGRAGTGVMGSSQSSADHHHLHTKSMVLPSHGDPVSLLSLLLQTHRTRTRE